MGHIISILLESPRIGYYSIVIGALVGTVMGILTE